MSISRRQGFFRVLSVSKVGDFLCDLCILGKDKDLLASQQRSVTEPFKTLYLSRAGLRLVT